jgi:hypothetical protein
MNTLKTLGARIYQSEMKAVFEEVVAKLSKYSSQEKLKIDWAELDQQFQPFCADALPAPGGPRIDARITAALSKHVPLNDDKEVQADEKVGG